MHAVQLRAAGRLPNWPAGQAVHADAPVATLLYVPTAHAVHTVEAVAPLTSLYVPARHPVHALAADASVLYEPAAQMVHPEVPVVSAL